MARDFAKILVYSERGDLSLFIPETSKYSDRGTILNKGATDEQRPLKMKF